jgi:hypothetical protein
MGEINVIFKGSMSIASNTEGKKLKREISLARRIEPGRKMKWSDMDIWFRPEDHPEIELSERNLPLTIGTPRPPSVKKGTYVALASNQPPADQQADDKK